MTNRPSGGTRATAPRELVPLDEARALVLGIIEPLDAVVASMDRALGCRLARDVVAPFPQPRFDNSAMDGYAVRAAAVPAGGGVIPRSAASPISTGMPIPEGADAVVPVERVRARHDRLEIEGAVAPGDHVRRAGEEVAAGAVALEAGSRLTPGALGLLSGFGYAALPVVPPPRVAILVTGDEVAVPGEPLGDGQVYDADGPLLRALVREAGGEIVAFERVPDDPRRIGQSLVRMAGGADLVCSTGGASVGTRDHLVAALARVGALLIHQLDMKPGRPTSMGLIGSVPAFTLPGNPLAVLLGFEALARPALRRLAGHPDVLRPRIRPTSRTTIGHRPGRLELVPVRLLPGRPPEAIVATRRRSAMLSGVAVADGLAFLEAERGTIEPGEPITVEAWGSAEGG